MTAAPPSEPYPAFSISVNRLAAEFGADGRDRETTASAIAAELLASHDYGNWASKGGSLPIDEGERRPLDAWLRDVESQFDLDLVAKTKHEKIDGVLTIWALSMLDDTLLKALTIEEVFKSLVNEVDPALRPAGDFESTVSSREGGATETRGGQARPAVDRTLTADETPSSDGGQAQTSTTEGEDPTPALNDDVRDLLPSRDDEPAVEDLLGRRAFAESLATRIRRLYDGEFSTLIHLYGPWGAGKTTLLGFIEQELKQPRPPESDDDVPSGSEREARERAGQRWSVVWFNAWQQQRSEPPWWQLHDAVFRCVSGGRRWSRLTLREHWWRVTVRWGSAALALLATIVVLGIITVVAWSTLGDIDRGVKFAGSVLTVASTIGAATYLIGRQLLLGPNSARAYAEAANDPAAELRKHFDWLVRRSSGPVAIFVDDLDRCNHEYVIEFLEGIQTIFRHAPVAFIVAADRAWLRASFEHAYRPFTEHVGTPGRPLGYLFLEKSFAFAVPLPRISPGLVREYLREITAEGATGFEARREEATRRAEAALADASEQELITTASRAEDDAFLAQARREEVVRKLQSIHYETEAEHRLVRYTGLLEPNPRGLKRLANFYAVARDAAILQGAHLDVDRFPLFVILAMRWPVLMEHLERYPGAIEVSTGGKSYTRDAHGALSDDLIALLQSEHVRQVATGVGATPRVSPLDAEAIAAWVGTREEPETRSSP